MKNLVTVLFRALRLEIKDTVYGYGIPDDAELRASLSAVAREVDPHCDINFPTFDQMRVNTWVENTAEMYRRLDEHFTAYLSR